MTLDISIIERDKRGNILQEAKNGRVIDFENSEVESKKDYTKQQLLDLLRALDGHSQAYLDLFHKDKNVK